MVIDRALSKVRYDRGCWEWTGAKDRDGYGRIFTGSRRDATKRASLAHRVVYEALVGPIPDGLVIDHLCRNPSCVNPDHMEVVTQGENMGRGKSRAQSHCPHGHEYTPENTIHVLGDNPKRICRECKKVWSARYKAKVKP